MHDSAEVLPGSSINHLLAVIWQRNLPLLRERLAGLSAAGAEADKGYLIPSARLLACDIAHKMAGSLGMFGYPQGTEIARELERLLNAEGPVSADRLNELTHALSHSLQI